MEENRAVAKKKLAIEGGVDVADKWAVKSLMAALDVQYAVRDDRSSSW